MLPDRKDAMSGLQADHGSDEVSGGVAPASARSRVHEALQQRHHHALSRVRPREEGIHDERDEQPLHQHAQGADVDEGIPTVTFLRGSQAAVRTRADPTRAETIPRVLPVRFRCVASLTLCLVSAWVRAVLSA